MRPLVCSWVKYYHKHVFTNMLLLPGQRAEVELQVALHVFRGRFVRLQAWSWVLQHIMGQTQGQKSPSHWYASCMCRKNSLTKILRGCAGRASSFSSCSCSSHALGSPLVGNLAPTSLTSMDTSSSYEKKVIDNLYHGWIIGSNIYNIYKSALHSYRSSGAKLSRQSSGDTRAKGIPGWHRLVAHKLIMLRNL